MIPLLFDFLAAYRLTRLITADTILDGPRDAVVRWAYRNDDGAREDVDPEVSWSEFAQNDDEKVPALATLVTCRFCAGVWVGFAVVAARRRFPRAWPPIAEALALSAGAALLAGLEG